MKNIPPLYHWSPSFNRADILAYGLTPTTPHRNGTLTVCLGTDPLSAWALSGALRTGDPDRERHLSWDLFQVQVGDTPVFRRKHWGRWVEYRIPRTIRPVGITHVATKTIGKDLA